MAQGGLRPARGQKRRPVRRTLFAWTTLSAGSELPGRGLGCAPCCWEVWLQCSLRGLVASQQWVRNAHLEAWRQRA
eukprot:5290191-Prorocentrum_lima.AAC.1